MHPYCGMFGTTKKTSSLGELEERANKISEIISCIRELQEKKDKLIEQMLEIIEEMRD